MITPATIAEMVDAVCASPRVNLAGAGTKPRLLFDYGTRIATTGLCGIVEYGASEYTITALAGTTLREIATTLAAQGQYLPFDPLLVASGATLGGTVAAGLSGPGRFRYGGLRDFILGVRFIDGTGRLLRVGGKVVKNAAGFDLPKFFVGSLGCYGALVECTFKVFPRAPELRTLALEPISDAELVPRLIAAGAARWEIDALDFSAADGRLLLRLAAAREALDALTTDVLARWPGRVLPADEAEETWDNVREFRWAHADGVWMKLAVTLERLPAALSSLRRYTAARLRVSAGGHVVWLSLPDAAAAASVSTSLGALALPAMTIRGPAELFPGRRRRWEIETRLKHALDPGHRFPTFDPAADGSTALPPVHS